MGESQKFTINIVKINVHLHSDNEYLNIIHKHNQQQAHQTFLQAYVKSPNGFGVSVQVFVENSNKPYYTPYSE